MFEFRHKRTAPVIICTALEELGFVNGFSTRLGGVSLLPEQALNLGYFNGDSSHNVTENRRRFLESLEVTGYRIHTLRQTHSRIVHRVEASVLSNTPVREGDALIGKSQEMLAGVLTADCQPVLLVDTKTRAYAAIHAGWRGTLQRIVEHAFAEMRQEFGTNPEDCHAALGPSASVECYEVGEEVVELFRAEFQYADELFQRPAGRVKQHLDVKTANYRQLLTVGIPPQQIYVSDYCTMRQTDLFFSYRCEQAKGRVGRLLSVVGRKK